MYFFNGSVRGSYWLSSKVQDTIKSKLMAFILIKNPFKVH